MLIDRLLIKPRHKVAILAELGHQQQKILLAEKWLLGQRAKSFIGTTPGVMLSFSAGCLFQLRHNSAVKMLRSVAGFRWLANVL